MRKSTVNVPRAVWKTLRRVAQKRGITTTEALRGACTLFVTRSERYAEYLRMVHGRVALARAAALRVELGAARKHRMRGPFVVVVVPHPLWMAVKAEAVARDLPVNTALEQAASVYADESARLVDFCALAADWASSRSRSRKPGRT